MYGQDNNPYAFRLMESCADHIHWAGGYWDTEGVELSQNDAFGGGHAHCGAMIYLGDNWPDQYRHSFFTINTHGHRINHDKLERRGSGYVAKHAPDVVKANDPWFRGVGLLYGHDGGVFMSDWCDAGECHDYEDIHRENGRIYKITYGTPKASAVNLANLSDRELIDLQSHKNDWQASCSRLELQRRAMAGTLDRRTRSDLLRFFREQSNPTQQLRLLWTLHVTDGTDDALSNELLAHRQEYVRSWAIQFLLEDRNASSSQREALAKLAATELSPVVRLSLASGLQRLPLAERLPLAQALASRSEDGNDANVPLMIWYGIEPLVSADDDAAAALLAKATIPIIRRFIAHRLSLRLALDSIVNAIAKSSDAGFERDAVEGMFDALNGRRKIKMPTAWPATASKLSNNADSAVREKAEMLSLVFGDANAAAQLRRRVTDTAQSVSTRQNALQALVQARVPGLAPLLHSLVSDAALRRAAIRGLAAFEDANTPKVILQSYSSLTPEEKADVISALTSRPQYAIDLLEAVKQGTVPARDISPFAARQIQAFRDPRAATLLASLLGEVRAVSKNKAAEIAAHKKLLTPEAVKAADPSRGRGLFNRACAACHMLFDEGGKLAPELTGSQRSNLDYILENVVDPNAIVWSRYRATYFETADDRLISGVVLQENESTVTIQTQTGTITLPRSDITSRKESTLSMMPDGIFDSLQPSEILDLVAYLQSPSQVPLPSSKSAP